MSDDEPSEEGRGQARRNPYSDTSSEEEEAGGDSGSERHVDSERPNDSEGEQAAKVVTAPWGI